MTRIWKIMCNVGFWFIQFGFMQCMEGTCLTAEKAVSLAVDKIHVHNCSEPAEKNREE
jgi:hypothetical protein